jgi:hypothetical protein
MKFKEGDILEFIGVETYSAKKGARAICRKNKDYLQVEWIRDGLDNNQMDGGYHSGWFIKVGELENQKEDRILKENKKVMIESRIERLIALDDYVKALGLEDGVGKLNILDAVGMQRQIEKIILDTLNELNVVEQFEQEDFDKKDIGL